MVFPTEEEVEVLIISKQNMNHDLSRSEALEMVREDLYNIIGEDASESLKMSERVILKQK